jgi:hypothetical protein
MKKSLLGIIFPQREMKDKKKQNKSWKLQQERKLIKH